MSDLAARMQQTLDHAQATGPNPTSQRALEYRLAEAINALASTPAPAPMHEAADELTALKAKVALLTEALQWYGKKARLARLIHSGGDPARFELSDDGGKRARAALQSTPTSDRS